MALTRPRRYQLNKAALRALEGGHPWIYRKQLSSAAAVFADGQWLRLVDGGNRVVGWGIHAAAGAIGVRVLARGPDQPDAAWVRRRVDEALARRAPLLEETNAYRAIHGENDGLPAVTVDVFDRVAILQTYAAGADALGRYAAGCVARAAALDAVVWKPSRRRLSDGPVPTDRVLRGRAPETVTVHEGPLRMTIAIGSGQKSGAFLDLRNLRRWVCAQALAGRRVLNLFSYTGTIGRAATLAGAAEVWNVDASAAALAHGRAHHDGAGTRWIRADLLAGVPLDPGERFDLIIVDPPQMTSRAAQVPRALAAYRHLYQQVARHLAPGGTVVACCCTSRVTPSAFRGAVEAGLGAAARYERRLPVELDHPVGYPEGDYLKVLIFRSTAGAA